MPDIIHRYYQKSSSEQSLTQQKVLVAVLLPALGISILCLFFELYILIFPIIWLGISFLAPFIDTPSLRKSGKLIYYSPLFIVQPSAKKLVIHGGTLFDYMFVLNKNDPPSTRSRIILLSYVRGMLALIKEYENEPETIVEGTSYIINTRTAAKVGLSQVPTNGIQKVIIMFNYFVLTASYSLVKSKLAFPKISDVKTYKATIGDLINQQYFLTQLEKKLTKSIGQK
ncbi:MAG: hypothetical protein NXI20_09895 [bacterium]|nr:hypothetical protein [bacterium]